MKSIYKNSLKNYVTKECMNQRLIEAEYQVRGTIAIKSVDYANRMKKGEKFRFEKLYPLNIGNPQALNQAPIQFPREVLSCLFYNNSLANKDAQERCKLYRQEFKSVEQYTDYRGMRIIRNNIANFINTRDNVANVTEDDIMLTNGAGGGIKIVLESLINSESYSVMTPIPQYPLYTALIKLLGCNAAGYYLKEEDGWSLDIENVQQIYKANYDKGKKLKAFVAINPGNPTGNILSENNIAEIIKFCYDNGMVILADEVYQINVYNFSKKFHSFRSVLSKMPYPYNKTCIFSFNSVSKGVFGECGMRGGYVDMANVPYEIVDLMKKLKVLEVCPNIMGQITTDCLVKPPSLNDSSKETVDLYTKQCNDNFNNLKIKADILSEELNKIPRISCQNIDGALYAFPSIDIPEFRVKEAKEKGIQADMLFCLDLLDNTGIVAVPGSGFGQKDGTNHIRLTNLINPKEEMITMTNSLKTFCEEYFKH